MVYMIDGFFRTIYPYSIIILIQSPLHYIEGECPSLYSHDSCIAAVASRFFRWSQGPGRSCELRL